MNAVATTLKAYAKINLFLRVFEREPNGYHRIDTLFQRLALADDVEVRVRGVERDLVVSWDGTIPVDIGPAEQNLAWRAALAYSYATDWPTGWDIRLNKRIPAGAGLGGGSSDAAAVLLALDQLAERPMGFDRLAGIGATLGADVAFFVHDCSLARGTGYGTVIDPLLALPVAHVVLAVPEYTVNTAAAYAALDRDRAQSPPPPHAPIDDLNAGSWGSLARIQGNDFEGTIFPLQDDLRAVRDWFEREGATVARLSGTGSTVFGLWAEGGPVLKAPAGFRLIETKTE
jgi:4-diphosphocytidyl-2-C-methyl-D-erythritol kinase